MVSSYEDIYEKYLGLVENHEVYYLSKSDAYLLMGEWMRSTISRPKVRRLFSSITVDDETMEITYTLRNSVDDEYDKTFVENMLASGMVIGWLEPKVKTDLQIMQYFSNSDSKFYAQSAHTKESLQLLKDARTTLDKDYVRDHGWNTLIINGGVT